MRRIGRGELCALMLLLGSCSFDPPMAGPAFAVGGTVRGLTGAGLVLGSATGETLTVTANGAFSFSPSLRSGEEYRIVIVAEPIAPPERCVINNGAGVIAAADVTDLSVACTPAPPSGAPDLSFGDQGVLSLDDVLEPGADEGARSIALDRYGRILLATVHGGGMTTKSVIWRFKEDGTPDLRFGDGGRVVLAAGPAGGFIEALHVTGDGTILAAGTRVESERKAEMWIVRLDRDGHLDASFGDRGVVLLGDVLAACSARPDGTAMHVAFGLAADAAGRVLVTGNGAERDCSDRDMLLLRLDGGTGRVDPSFGERGVFESQSIGDFAADAREDNGQTVFAAPDGSILIAGNTNLTVDFATAAAVVWKIRPDGSADPTFNTRGFVVLDDIRGGRGADTFRGLAVDAGSRIVAGGHSFNGRDQDAVVVRFLPDGSLDPAFGERNGIAVIRSERGDDRARRVLLDRAERVLVLGRLANGADTDVALARLTTAGVLDPSFGERGLVLYDGTHGNDTGEGLVIDAQERLLIAATVTGAAGDSAITLLRVHP